MHLGSVLAGQALDVYTNLPSHITDNYDSLKKELLLGFNKTPEGYRVDFRNLKVVTDQTYRQFSAKLRRSLDLWLDSVGVVPRTYDNLCEFMVADQFFAAVPSELRSHLKEMGISKLEDIVTRADCWASAHKHDWGKSKKYMSSETSKSEYKPKISPVVSRDKIPVKCYHCREVGHTKFYCPLLAPSKQESIHNVNFRDSDEATYSEDSVHV